MFALLEVGAHLLNASVSDAAADTVIVPVTLAFAACVLRSATAVRRAKVAANATTTAMIPTQRRCLRTTRSPS